VLKSKVEKIGSVLEVTLSGDIVDDTFCTLRLGCDQSDVSLIRCRVGELTRINSVGVKSWLTWVRDLQKCKTPFVFAECSLSIVEQMNLMTGFTGDGPIESIYAPYMCTSCSREFTHLLNAEDLKKLIMPEAELPHPSCPRCKSQETSFDDLPDFFAFLRWSKLAG
jgi:DNA-directed RNA polymerase subunit RPC12/RpoP